MPDRPPLRRAEFDEIANGWGSDSFHDLGARIDLVEEFKVLVGTLTHAEDKILAAMESRHQKLGAGLPS
jgi:hypothetical protein